MPEPIKSEEEVNRQQFVCQFNVSGTRCSDCPWASTSHLQRRRCPFHVEEPEDPDKERTGEAAQADLREAASSVEEARVHLLSSASSSSEVPEVESLSDEFSKLSLADPSASGSSSTTLAVPSQDVGFKRKVDDVRRSNYEKEIYSQESKGQSVPVWLNTKQLKPFAEATEDVSGSYPKRRFLQHLMRVSEDPAAAIASSSTFTAFIPGPLIVSDVPGVFSWHDDMEIDGP